MVALFRRVAVRLGAVAGEGHRGLLVGVVVALAEVRARALRKLCRRQKALGVHVLLGLDRHRRVFFSEGSGSQVRHLGILARQDYEYKRAKMTILDPKDDSWIPDGSEPLKARAAHDRFAAVGEADERLPPAVVVGRPDGDHRLVAADAAGLIPLGFETSPEADERVLLPLAADRRLVGVTRKDARAGRQLHQHVHYRASNRRHVAPSTDCAAKQDVARKAGLLVDYERDVIVGV